MLCHPRKLPITNANLRWRLSVKNMKMENSFLFTFRSIFLALSDFANTDVIFYYLRKTVLSRPWERNRGKGRAKFSFRNARNCCATICDLWSTWCRRWRSKSLNRISRGLSIVVVATHVFTSRGHRIECELRIFTARTRDAIRTKNVSYARNIAKTQKIYHEKYNK